MPKKKTAHHFHTKKYWCELAVTSALILISIPVILIFKLQLLASTVLFFIIPAVYILSIDPRTIPRVLTAAFVGLGFGVLFDLFGSINKAWYVPDSALFFPYRLWGVVSVDGVIWFFGWVLFMVAFYKHFIDHDRATSISANFKYAVATSVSCLSAVLVLLWFNPELLNFKYAYVLIISLNLPVFLFAIFHNRSLILKFSQATLYFFFVFLAFEYVGLKNNQWVFTGNYLHSLPLLDFMLPAEEFFFWILLSGSVALSYYELFIDDGK